MIIYIKISRFSAFLYIIIIIKKMKIKHESIFMFIVNKINPIKAMSSSLAEDIIIDRVFDLNRDYDCGECQKSF
jgi:hypothetical protein